MDRAVQFFSQSVLFLSPPLTLIQSLQVLGKKVARTKLVKEVVEEREDRK